MKSLRVLLLPLSLFCSASFGQESFSVELGQDGETIADMRPVFLKFESRPLPAISPAEVARRYQRLFNKADEPSVRVDALNRLANIRDRSGQDIGLPLEEETDMYRQVIESYETILERGGYSGPMDELLYQMAKAHALIGQNEASVQRLQQLVGQYPNSPLVGEARFRVAESAFADGRYVEAEAEYSTLVDGEGAVGDLKNKARYMLGWSLFKQGPQAWERAGQRFVAVLDESIPSTLSLNQIPESSVDSIDDTLRILALMASRRDGAETLMGWLQPEASRSWTPLVFDRLADLYAVQNNPEASVATNRAFVSNFPKHPQRAGFMSQIVDVWSAAGRPVKARDAMADYVALFNDQAEYAGLDDGYRTKWRKFSRFLADFYYTQGDDEKGNRVENYRAAATYYEGLASRSDAGGELYRLAGDAWLQAAAYPAALRNFQVAAYELSGYDFAADAGWAAVALIRAGARGEAVSSEFNPDLADLSVETDRFVAKYGADNRAPELLAYLANRWLESGNNDLALQYAVQAVDHSKAAPETRYAGWLVTAQVHQNTTEYSLAEGAWREALALTSSDSATPTMEQEAPELRQQLATAIYRQGEQAAEAGKPAIAVAHFQRIETVLPGSEIAIKGRFDAANTLLRASDWQPAINELNRFRADYPTHDLASDIGEKLVLAYTSSSQPIRAARELIDIADNQSTQSESTGGDDLTYRLRAAELFHTGEAFDQRNAVYADYLATSPIAADAEEHIRLQTMRHRLTESGTDPAQWRAKLVSAELESDWHSTQTLQWAARGSLAMGAEAAAEFGGVELSMPLEESLARKQRAMQKAQTHFRNAESLGGAGVLPESLFRRAELHRIMARDLMASTAPDDLNELEQMQYTMLLEEEAYPFEERAIALHSENHQGIATTGFNVWVEKSLDVLAKLHPGRYDRSLRWMSVSAEGENDGV